MLYLFEKICKTKKIALFSKIGIFIAFLVLFYQIISVTITYLKYETVIDMKVKNNEEQRPTFTFCLKNKDRFPEKNLSINSRSFDHAIGCSRFNKFMASRKHLRNCSKFTRIVESLRPTLKRPQAANWPQAANRPQIGRKLAASRELAANWPQDANRQHIIRNEPQRFFYEPQ
jgi:hypothetical protein